MPPNGEGEPSYREVIPPELREPNEVRKGKTGGRRLGPILSRLWRNAITRRVTGESPYSERTAPLATDDNAPITPFSRS